MEKGTNINKRLETDRQTVKLSLLSPKAFAWRLHHPLLSVDPRSRYCECQCGKSLHALLNYLSRSRLIILIYWYRARDYMEVRDHLEEAD